MRDSHNQDCKPGESKTKYIVNQIRTEPHFQPFLHLPNETTQNGRLGKRITWAKIDGLCEQFHENDRDVNSKEQP